MKSISSSTILSILLLVCALVQTSFASNPSDVDAQNIIVRRRAAVKKVRARGNNQQQARVLSSSSSKSSKSPKSMKSSKSPKSMKSGSSKMPKAMMMSAATASSDGAKMENVMTVAALSTAAYFML
ncbi:predicted protein [Chaetoceros tenuissimus]|uniref:Uncharacterized protein n=1 Tax=Chaetoceros tenuissimus TaxID=426638 RepID=A0AAD3H0R7_9STRA|nr:predicted protein [Chaetoceros tenuissimus]